MNYFCFGNFRIYEQNLSGILSDDPVINLVAIEKTFNKVFEKQLQRNPFLR